jgi:hypothetical protein
MQLNPLGQQHLGTSISLWAPEMRPGIPKDSTSPGVIPCTTHTDIAKSPANTPGSQEPQMRKKVILHCLLTPGQWESRLQTGRPPDIHLLAICVEFRHISLSHHGVGGWSLRTFKKRIKTQWEQSMQYQYHYWLQGETNRFLRSDEAIYLKHATSQQAQE